ncbi:MAG: nitroreductase family protein [Synergistaceae bacterium]|jgi:nitroreductase|nr:nitroreductase family protein [Synergistaceae bacterium]
MSFDPVFARRSIRRYKPDAVPAEKVTTLLEAAMAAPSAHNQQPWEFVVIDDRAILDAIPDVHPYSKMLHEAPLAILVCARLEGLSSPDFFPQDCAAATENILVEAAAQGLGTVWMGIYPKEPLMTAMRKMLHVPDEIVPFSLIAVGYGAEEKAPSKRYDPARIHHNSWT